MNLNTKTLFENSSVSLVKEEKIEIKIPLQEFSVKYYELEDLTIFEKYIVKVIDEFNKNTILKNQKIDYKQIADILCLDTILIEKNIKRLIEDKILSSNGQINWTNELNNWQKKVLKSRKLSLYFTNSDYELFQDLDYNSKEEVIIENVDLKDLDLIEIVFDEITYKLDYLNVIIYFDQKTLQLSTVVEHDNQTFYLEKSTAELSNTYQITNYKFADLSLWEFGEAENDEDFQEALEKKILIDGLEIELTPSKYLYTEEEKHMRSSLFFNPENHILRLEHDKNNAVDDFAIKVICDDVMIGYILKYKDQDEINKFCFNNGNLMDIKLFLRDKKLYLKLNDEQLESHEYTYEEWLEIIENISFEKIRRYCENLSKAGEADEMQKSLGEKGKMHKALIYDALEQFIEKLNGKTITLCDWGCSQGIASMLVLDYIKEKQLNIKVSDVILIDDDTNALSRAMAQVEALAQESIKFTPIKSDDNTIYDKIKSNNKILNLFANDKLPIDLLDIDYDIFEDSYFLCVSNEKKEFVNEVHENISDFIDLQDVSIRDGKIGRFQKFERVFKTKRS